MIYKTFPPSPQLNDVVRNYTIIHFQFNGNQAPPPKQRSPKPEQKIVFYVKGSVNLPDTPSGRIYQPPPIAIYTHQLSKRNLQVTPEFLALIVYLQPGALHRLMGISMSAFPGAYLDAELLFGTGVRLVSEQLAAATSPSVMIPIVEKFMLGCKQQIKGSMIDTIAGHILSDPASFSLDTLAGQANLSSRQFYRNFLQRIGMTPKLFSRLTRFNHAFRSRLMKPSVSWSSIALEYGYTDYHHLEKEFKEFIGVTPNEWIAAEMQAPERQLNLR